MSKNQNPRKESEDISEGKTEPHHIGKQTIETIQQEIFSLKNTNPMFRGNKWKKRHAKLGEQIRETFQGKENETILKDLLGKWQDAHNRMEL